MYAKPKQKNVQDSNKEQQKLNENIFTIEKKQTSKDDIEQPEDVLRGIIPPLGSSLLLCGKSGSGKSTLLASLVNDDKDRFYTGYFDKIFLFSPTAGGDDIQKQYGIDPKLVFTDLEEAVDILKTIQDSQKKAVKDMGSDNAPNYAIIFDDIIGDTKFMNSTEFTKCFYQTRHINCTTFLCTQHYKRVPRVCRLQASFVCFFKGSRSEVEMIAEEFAPPLVDKKSFMSIIDKVVSEPYAFFTINMKVPWEERFRKNLYPIIPIKGNEDGEIVTENKETNPVNIQEKNGTSEKGTERATSGESTTKKQRTG